MTFSLRLKGHDTLVDCFYRTNYAVFMKSTIALLESSDSALWQKLQLEYRAKWPIASKMAYDLEFIEEDWDDVEENYEQADCSGYIVLPCSLMYSMPDRWQRDMAKICEALQCILADDRKYKVSLKMMLFYPDPFQSRHSRWDSDSFLASTLEEATGAVAQIADFYADRAPTAQEAEIKQIIGRIVSIQVRPPITLDTEA